MNKTTNSDFAALINQLQSDNQTSNVIMPNVFSSQHSSVLLDSSDTETQQFLEQLTYIVISESFASNRLTKFHGNITSLELIPCTEAMVLAALIGVPSILSNIGTTIKRTGASMHFPQNVLQCRHSLKSTVDCRTFSTEQRGASYSWFHHANKLRKLLYWDKRVTYLLTCILMPTSDGNNVRLDYKNLALLFQGKVQFSADTSSTLRSFCQHNRKHPSLLSIHDKLVQFRAYCQRHIMGQQEAIEQLCEMMGCAFSVPTGSGPLGIATFMGASGTGKTSMAELIADGLNKFLTTGYSLLTLDMEQYSHKEASAKLFGTGSQYTDSALGDLTTAVLLNPRTVIVFDEIEKAHPCVRQSLLTLLEKGMVRDQTSNLTVDFQYCFIIFTTNLGSHHAMQSAETIQHVDLASLLRSDASEHSLSPEFISRLCKGHIALFRPLSIQQLLNLAEAQAQQLQEDLLFTWPDNTADILVETLGGNLSPRTIKSQRGKLQQQILQQIFSSGIELQENKSIHLEIPEDTTSLLFAVVTKSLKLTKQFQKLFPQVIVFKNLHLFLTSSQSSSTAMLLLHNTEFTQQRELSNHLLQLKVFKFGSGLEDANAGSLIHKSYMIKKYTKATLQGLVQKAAKRTRLLAMGEHYRRRNMLVHFDYRFKQDEFGITALLVNPRYSFQFNQEDFTDGFMQIPTIPEHGFEQVVGMEKIKHEFKIIMRLLRGEHIARLELPSGYLLSGPAGTGKSHFARAVAGECGIPFIAVNAADLMQGDVVANINHMFKVAEQYAPSILFLDEFDVIGLNRIHRGTMNHLATNTLLTRMDGFKRTVHPVFILAATNLADKLDPAVVRHGRFDKEVVFTLPDLKARKAFLEQLYMKYALDVSQVDSDSLAKLLKHMTFGAIRALLQQFQMESLNNGQSTTAEALLQYATNQITGDRQNKPANREFMRQLSAYHQAGHLIMQHYWSSPQQHNASNSNKKWDSSELVIQTLLAGRAAELLFCQDPTRLSQNAYDDLKQATKLAVELLCKAGVSSTLGHADFQQLPTKRHQIESEATQWLTNANEACLKTLRQYWPEVQKLSKELMKKDPQACKILKSLELVVHSGSSMVFH